MNKQETDNPTIIEDLSVEVSRQDEVKGGPRMSCSNNLKQLGLAAH